MKKLIESIISFVKIHIIQSNSFPANLLKSGFNGCLYLVVIIVIEKLTSIFISDKIGKDPTLTLIWDYFEVGSTFSVLFTVFFHTIFTSMELNLKSFDSFRKRSNINQSPNTNLRNREGGLVYPSNIQSELIMNSVEDELKKEAELESIVALKDEFQKLPLVEMKEEKVMIKVEDNGGKEAKNDQ
jgi:hypothetical protein